MRDGGARCEFYVQIVLPNDDQGIFKLLVVVVVVVVVVLPIDL